MREVLAHGDPRRLRRARAGSENGPGLIGRIREGFSRFATGRRPRKPREATDHRIRARVPDAGHQAPDDLLRRERLPRRGLRAGDGRGQSQARRDRRAGDGSERARGAGGRAGRAAGRRDRADARHRYELERLPQGDACARRRPGKAISSSASPRSASISSTSMRRATWSIPWFGSSGCANAGCGDERAQARRPGRVRPAARADDRGDECARAIGYRGPAAGCASTGDGAWTRPCRARRAPGGARDRRRDRARARRDVGAGRGGADARIRRGARSLRDRRLRSHRSARSRKAARSPARNIGCSRIDPGPSRSRRCGSSSSIAEQVIPPHPKAKTPTRS